MTKENRKILYEHYKSIGRQDRADAVVKDMNGNITAEKAEFEGTEETKSKGKR